MSPNAIILCQKFTVNGFFQTLEYVEVFTCVMYSERLQNVARIWKNGQNGRHGAGRPFLPFRAIFWSRSEYFPSGHNLAWIKD